MTKKHEKMLRPDVIRGFKIKMTMKYHYIPIRTAKIKNTENTKSW